MQRMIISFAGLGEAEASVIVDGRQYPAPCIFEDDQGIRTFAIPAHTVFSVPAHTWARAFGDAPSALAFFDEERFVWQAITIERWMDLRTEVRLTSSYLIDRRFLSTFGTFPTYLQIVGATSQPATDLDLPSKSQGGLVHLHAHSEFCLAPETRVVTADLTWKRIDQVVVGEQLVGFDEDLRPPEGEKGNSRSKMRRTTVLGVKRVVRDCYRITLEDGTEIVASAQHGWVVNGTTRGSQIAPGGPSSGFGPNTRRWVTTEELLQGRTRPKMILWASPWGDLPEDLSREAGWLAGVADGEGWLHEGQFSFGQNPGFVLDEMKRVCKALGYPITDDRVQGKAPCRTFRLAGYETAMRFFSQCRPVRFAGRTDEVWVGRRAGGRYTRPVQIVSVEHLGDRETIAIETTTKTFVAEGFLSHNSALDGFSHVAEMVEQAIEHGQDALALTDHGVCAGHPALQAETAKVGIKPIFGIEAYFVDDRHFRPMRKPVRAQLDDYEWEKALAEWQRQQQLGRDYWHLVLWAENDTGLKNIWAAASEAQREGMYRHPRMDWETLARFSEGVRVSTACLRGPLSSALLNDQHELAQQRLGRLLDTFDGRVNVEIHTNQLPNQILLNKRLVEMAHDYSLPVVAVSDSHYPTDQHQSCHKVWIATQLDKDLQDDGDLFAGAEDYHLLGELEARQALSYLPKNVIDEAIANTSLVASQCDASIKHRSAVPVFSKRPTREASIYRDIERVVEIAMSNWHKTTGKFDSKGDPIPEEVYEARFEREMKLLIEKGFCGYFLMVAEYCRWARAQGYLVGPGRGSGGGCLVAYLCNITEIDPVEADLIFERFLTAGRKGLPDFDVDFPTVARDAITAHIIEEYGEDHVVRVGSHMYMRNKKTVRALAKALGSSIEIHYPDIDAICKIIDAGEADAAGLGKGWDDIWAAFPAEFEMYSSKYPTLFDLAGTFIGRLNGYGKHAAGVVISPEAPLTGEIPMRYDADTGHAIAEWNMEQLDEIGLVKFDILTIRNLDTLQMAVEMHRDLTGEWTDLYSWTDEYKAPEVWDEICAGRTLGMFQIETYAGTAMCKRHKPRSMADLADVITLVRPGPMRSGLTDTYLRRRFGEEAVSFPHPLLEKTLAKTYGCILYQEDVMNVCMVLAGYDENEADAVRKILGKKKVEEARKAGEKFVLACDANGIDRSVSEPLWAQMEEFAKYCVTGDTVVSLAGAGQSSDGTVTVGELYRRIHTPLLEPVRGRTRSGEEYQGPCVVCGTTEATKFTRGACNACYVWRQKFSDPSRGLQALALHDDGRIRPARLLDVFENGDQEVWRVTLADGRFIDATADHKHLTPEGERRVDQLVLGDTLLVDAGYEPQVYDPDRDRLTAGGRSGVGVVNGAYGDANVGFIDGGHALWAEFRRTAPNYCHACGATGGRLEVAHIDGNRKNNAFENLALWCTPCHKKYDYANNDRRRRWGKGHPAAPVEITSIVYVGVRPTYTVVMSAPHNWVGNGIVTANSFNRAHAWGYAIIAYWCAWMKVQRPLAFLTALLSTVDADRLPDFVEEARQRGYTPLGPDINSSGRRFSVVG